MIKLTSFSELLDYSESSSLKLFDIFQKQESQIKEIEIEEIRAHISATIQVMNTSIKNGLANKEISKSGISGQDSNKVKERYLNKKIKTPFGETFGKIIYYAVAIMEENLRMGKIVACPTAGSCGIVPASIIAYAEHFDISIERQIDALITAGGIGKIIANKVALAGAVAGCQAECGVASAMATGGITELMNGSSKQIMNSAAMALKNLLGLACDPVAGLVEIPCVKRNGFLAIHATTASEMALSGVTSAIPLDEVVDAMKQVGLLMSPLLKECSEAGLATTKTGLKIAQNLSI